LRAQNAIVGVSSGKFPLDRRVLSGQQRRSERKLASVQAREQRMNLTLLKHAGDAPSAHPARLPAHADAAPLARILLGHEPEAMRNGAAVGIVVAIGGNLLLRRGGVLAEVASESAMLLEEAAHYSVQCLGQAHGFSVLFGAAVSGLGGQQAGSRRIHSEWIGRGDSLLQPLIELYRRCRFEPEGKLDDRGAVAGFLYGLRLRQQSAETRLTRCPGRTMAHKRDVFGRLARVAAMLDAPAGSPADLATLAALANYSPTHFLRLFAAVHGASPHDYQVQVRLRKAHHLVLNSRHAIRDIAESVGFESRSTFNRLFRRAFGRSAADLREQPLRWLRQVQTTNRPLPTGFATGLKA
jgi:AraC-like DNA-binding protein